MDEPDRTSLVEIAARAGTNKGSARPGRPTLAQVYALYLEALRDSARSVLEIGVKRGASLRMWAEYFPNARIWGVDINPAAVRHGGGAIEIRIGDQGDAAFVDAVAAEAGPFDLVVDDGSHRFDDQRDSLLMLWPHLRAGGVYVVEDCHTSFRPRYGGGPGVAGTFVEFAKRLLDDVYFREHAGPFTLDRLEDLHVHSRTMVLRKADRS